MPAQGDIDEDDLSDISMSAETEESDSDDNDIETLYSEPAKQQSTRQDSDTALLESSSRKRKVPSDSILSSEDTPQGNEEFGLTKRVKLELAPDITLQSIRSPDGRLPSDRSLLPAEIWHHIFTFAPPRTLGLLLRVNKIFRAYLDPISPASSSIIASLSQSQVPLRQPEVIWQAATRLYCPWMPHPLDGLSVLGMWKLACNFTCEFCDKRQYSVSSVSPDQWRSGPGEAGVRPVWAFAIRSCGACLQLRTIKEIDLLLSSSVPSTLMTALPFIFLTNELHIVASTTLQQGQPPTDMQINKYFFKPHVDEIKQEFFKIKALGSETAEKWIKGLDNRGKDKRLDIMRWERWESSGGLQRMNSGEPSDLQVNTAKANPQLPATIPMRLEGNSSYGPHGFSKIPVVSNEQPQTSNFTMHRLPAVVQFPTTLPQRFDSPTQIGFGPFPRPVTSQARHERTKEEVDKLKAARRTEIERRCLLLDPPITPNLLTHMTSFQAALQIVKPFDDSAWEMLKPRLLSQRADAQLREDDRVAQTRATQDRLEERLHRDGQPKEVKEFVDHEWEDAQSIIRSRIGAYADEIIGDSWAFGRKVNKETSPRFAAEVLLYVRKRFYAEIAKEDAQNQASGQDLQSDSPNGLVSRKLSLDNMRWVFDMKVKPHTEQYRKELFHCSGCENFKWYAFEGVCQHYASKHTSALSLGSVVVHWKAEWPEEPPFNPEPSLGKSTIVPATSSAAPYINGSITAPPVLAYGGYHGEVASMPPTSHNPQVPVYHSMPGQYTEPTYVPEQYPRQGQAPHIPGNFQTYPTGFTGVQYQPHHAAVYQPYATVPHTSFELSYSAAPAVIYDVPQTTPIYSDSNYEPPTATQTHQPAAATEMPSHIPPVVYRTEAYKAQLQDIAQIAKGLWNSTTGVKDMPGSVRVYTILYHIIQRSREKYTEDPSLNMLIDGLQNNKNMRPVRNVNGLACKTCKIERANKPINPHTVSSKGTNPTDRKLFSFPQLLNHFRSSHIENPKPATTSSTSLDWTTDMIELPDKKKIKGLPNASGMDEYKLELIKEALPDAFSPDTPEPEPEPEKPHESYRGVSQENSRELAPSMDKHEQYYTLPSHKSPSPPLKTRHHQDFMAGQSATENRRQVELSGRHPRPNSVAPDSSDQTSTDYTERRAVSPMGNKRIKREIHRDVNFTDDRFYTSVPGSYRPLYDVDHRGRSVRPKGLTPHLEDIPLRPEYNYEEANLLPRLVEKASRLAKPSSPRYHEQPSEGRVNDSYYRDQPSYRSTVYGTKPAVAQQWSRLDPRDAGSEDGEVANQSASGEAVVTKDASTDARIAAEQFLNNILPADRSNDVTISPGSGQRLDAGEARSQWAPERDEGGRHAGRLPIDPAHRLQYSSRNEEYRLTNERAAKRNRSPSPPHMRPVPEAAGSRQPQYIPYDYDSRLEAPRPVYVRHRSSEMVDRRYVIDDMVYRDDRFIDPDSQPRNGRFVSYENLRYDDEAPLSPVYITNPAPERRQYRPISPDARRYVPQEPIYESRPMQHHERQQPQPQMEHVAYERVPRPEYYRLHVDEQTRRHQYEPQIEYMRADAQSEYVVQRPVRREQEAMYAYEEQPRYDGVQSYEDSSRYDEPPRQRQPRYEEEPHRRSVHERAGPSRSDPAYYEEYDPRYPAPPPEVAQRPLRYE